jgi:hypothetical protein
VQPPSDYRALEWGTNLHLHSSLGVIQRGLSYDELLNVLLLRRALYLRVTIWLGVRRTLVQEQFSRSDSVLYPFLCMHIYYPFLR